MLPVKTSWLKIVPIKTGRPLKPIWHSAEGRLFYYDYWSAKRFSVRYNEYVQRRSRMLLENKLGIDHSYYYEGYELFKATEL